MKAIQCKDCKYFISDMKVCKKKHTQSYGYLNCAAYKKRPELHDLIVDRKKTCYDCKHIKEDPNKGTTRAILFDGISYCNRNSEVIRYISEDDCEPCDKFDESIKTTEQPEKKFDNFGKVGQKNRLDLLPFKALMAVGEVLTYAEPIHGANTWQDLPNYRARYTGADLRHFFKHNLGELYDKDSKLLHLAHHATNALFLLEKQLELEDNKGGK